MIIVTQKGVIFVPKHVLFLFCLSIFLLTGFNAYAENWVTLTSARDSSYGYDKDSITTIDDLKQVYDGTVTRKGQMTRQIMVDCSKKKYAIGEVVQWVGDREISRTYWAKNGFVWFSPKNRNESKLISAVCSVHSP